MAPNDPYGHLKRLCLPLVLLSAVTNFAVLVSPIFMMQVLDRVVPSGNLSTLALLLLVAVGALIAQAFVEFIRDATFQRVSRWVEAVGAPTALALTGSGRQEKINQIGALSGFFRSSLATTSLNLPWIPLFLIATALIHPLFLVLIIGVAFTSIAIKAIGRFMTQDTLSTGAQLSGLEQRALQNAINYPDQAGTVAIGHNLTQEYFALQSRRHLIENQATLAKSGETAALSWVRALTQILALSLGAYLVVQNSLSAGGMIAASILVSKTTMMLESVFSSLPDLRDSLQNFKQLREGGAVAPNSQVDITDLSGALKCEGLIYPRGGGAPPRLDRVSFQIEPGQCLAVIGVAGSGKTTLLHALSGLDPSPIGAVTLDESDVRTLSSEAVTQQIGYLPQQAGLLPGSLAQNISCFEPQPNDEAIISAAKLAGVHGLISGLPDAYATDIGAAPYLLSSGQKQRVALARALYYQPRYLFLDEPNALLDAEGERQLCDTLARVKEQGTTIVMILHRAGIMGLADYILRLDHGRVADFGERAEVLARFNAGKQKLELPLTANSLQDLTDWVLNQFSRSTDQGFCQKANMVATELFNLACGNSPKDEPQHAVFQFRFIDEAHCELTMIEQSATKLADKMQRVTSVVKHPDVDMMELEPDEMALAIVAQLSDKMNVENINDSGVYAVHLSSDTLSEPSARAH